MNNIPGSKPGGVDASRVGQDASIKKKGPLSRGVESPTGAKTASRTQKKYRYSLSEGKLAINDRVIDLSVKKTAKLDGETITIDMLNMRQFYENDVKKLAKAFEKPLAEFDSMSVEEQRELTHAMHGARRELGVQYKEYTPAVIRNNFIYPRNKKKYGDKLGPSVDYLMRSIPNRARQKGIKMTESQVMKKICETSAKPGGQDLVVTRLSKAYASMQVQSTKLAKASYSAIEGWMSAAYNAIPSFGTA